MRRKPAIIALSVVAAALIAAVTLPWWLGAALGAAGGRFGVTFAEYRRVGYARFALEGLRVKTDEAEVTVSRVELNTPLAWLGGRPGHVAVDDWLVEVTGSGAPASGKPGGWVPLRARLDRILSAVETRLPSASARKGTVAWNGGRIELGATTWRDGEVTIEGLRWRGMKARVAAKRDAAADRWTVRMDNAEQRWVVNAVSTGEKAGVDGTWYDQPWAASATFAPTGWLPREARADAAAWSVQGARLRLGEFYEKLNAGGSVVWRDRALSVDMQAVGEPAEGAEVPPMNIVLHGSGAADRLSLDRLEITLPGVTGTLSEPLSLASGGRLLTTGSPRFDLTADLADQPWFKGSGRVTGSVNVTPGDDGVPLLDGVLETDNAIVAGQTVKTAEVAVRVQWPDVHVKAATLELAGGDRLAMDGRWQAKTRTLRDATLSAQVSRATAARWLPEHAHFEQLTVKALAQGTWPEISHSGTLKTQALRIAPLKALSGEINWKGGGKAAEFMAMVDAGETSMRLGGAVDAQSVRMEELVLTQDGEDRLRLVQPARVAWAPALKIDPLEFTGPDSRLAGNVDWGERGSLRVEATRVRSTLLRDLVALPGPEWVLSALDVKGAWTDGPLVFTAKGDAAVFLTDGRMAELALSARGDASGLAVETLGATMKGRPVATMSGKAPLSLWPWSHRRVRLEDDGPITLNAVTSPHAGFWEQLAQLTGLVITEPDVNVSLAGTVKKPAGEGTLRIGKISAGKAEWARSLPDVDNLAVRVTGDRGGLVLEDFSADVSGQAVRANGRLPVKDWAALVNDPLALARTEGEARIEIPDAEVAALARYAPTYLSPAGTLHVDVSLKPGGELHGSIRLKDAATRPLGPLGILQSIGAEIELDGRTVIFKDVHATAGGQPVTLAGTASLEADRVARLDLALKGDNLPFVRQAGLLVRGDLDLRIRTGDDDMTRITGSTRLRDSLFLMDVRALLPSGGARNAPGRRPPYFAVQAAPFDSWVLDVTLAGDRFLRLRTPVFNGVASANFRLSGTLGDPRVTGEAVVNQGQVLLPFATFAVRQGQVRITERDPFEPRIALTGTSRRYGYDLRMEISGSTERPQLTFISTPALESEQVLLMVMAGETPQNETNYTGRERAARLGTYLGRSLLGELGADPTASDRLSISVGERISRQGRETYDVEYELDPRWSLVGQYDEFDEYNVGVKWRLFSQKTRQRDKEEAAGDED